MPPHVHIDFVVPATGCGRSVTDFRDWGAHRAQLRCPDDVSDDMYECGVPGGDLNQNSTGYLDHGQYADISPARKNFHGRTGNRTRYLIVSSQKLWPGGDYLSIFNTALTLNFNFRFYDYLTRHVAPLVICIQTEDFHLNFYENVTRWKIW
jgi:hypothetical protein